jgi:hypothetical protein
MRSSHASKVGRNWAAQYHRTMNPPPLRLRKSPERVWRLRQAPPEQVCAHLLTVARPTAAVIARDCCQRGNRFSAPNDGHRTAPQSNGVTPLARNRLAPGMWFPDVVADGNRAKHRTGGTPATHGMISGNIRDHR